MHHESADGGMHRVSVSRHDSRRGSSTFPLSAFGFISVLYRTRVTMMSATQTDGWNSEILTFIRDNLPVVHEDSLKSPRGKEMKETKLKN